MKSYKLYTESKIDSIVATPTSLTIGKYAIVKDVEVSAYDYASNKTNTKIISTPTRKNIEQIEKVCDNVIIDKIYKADLSKGRGVYSTFVSGSIGGVPFMWVRRETRSTAASQTLLYTPTTKIQGTNFRYAINLPTLFKLKGGGYKCIKRSKEFLEVTYGTQYTEIAQTGFGELNSVLPPIYIIANEYMHRDGNEPAHLCLSLIVDKKIIYDVVNNGRQVYSVILQNYGYEQQQILTGSKQYSDGVIKWFGGRTTKFDEFFDYLQRKEFS